MATYYRTDGLPGFAYDTLLITTGIDLATMRQYMQLALQTTLTWGMQEQLVFNPAKTVAVVFHTKNKPQTIPPLTMQGQDITFADSTRYLGNHPGQPTQLEEACPQPGDKVQKDPDDVSCSSRTHVGSRC